MEIERLLNCTNCGAVLTASTDQIINCAYCGTVYHQKLQTNNTLSSTETATEDTQREPESAENGKASEAFQSDNYVPDRQNRSLGANIIIIASVIIIITIAIVKKMGQDQAPRSNTLTIDTVMRFGRTQPTKLTDMEQSSLEKLSTLDIDQTLFNKLYKNADVSGLSSGIQETNVIDNKSIFGKPISGLYIDIYYSDAGYSIYFGSQHLSKNPLELQGLTFIINDEHLQYQPNFSADTLQHLTNDYSHEMIYGIDVLMLLKLATADKVAIHFMGKNGQDQIILPKDQQDALKRQLQIYKGLLLGYAK
ncbi:hypothetical protein SNE26_11070 [Mucilaginibacter sp. cycad4]|uniref:hypothetical protein n=1 Tax=Mucilaginibacter sp. cycad4 TaxID=3342096 RepID=UPI002AAB4D51|nr:hypothetical protein [Mucilaginibacter gossypii]WPV02317.1 hypothetical protein SNE26_11070 [Mucilaginibacter gossypii]